VILVVVVITQWLVDLRVVLVYCSMPVKYTVHSAVYGFEIPVGCSSFALWPVVGCLVNCLCLDAFAFISPPPSDVRDRSWNIGNIGVGRGK